MHLHALTLLALFTASPATAADPGVSIPPESLTRLNLKFAVATAARTSTEVRAPGTIQPNAYRQVHVTPLVTGVLIKISAELGQSVKRGQPLAQIFSSDFAETQMNFAALTAEFEAEHLKLMRTTDLVALGAASREELETVEAAHRVHQVHVDAARQKLLLLGLTDAQIATITTDNRINSTIAIPAPMDGSVILRNANLGQVVSLAQELFTVADLSTVWVEGSLFEKDFANVRIGTLARIATPAYPNRSYSGKVSYIDPRVDPQTRTAAIRVAIPNPAHALRFGMYVDMIFTTQGRELACTVPQQSVQSVGSETVVYLPTTEPGHFEQRTVKISPAQNGTVRIAEGLKPGEKVVTDGSFLLRAEAIRQHAP